MNPVCKRNYEETCDCVWCWAERERRRRAEEEAAQHGG